MSEMYEGVVFCSDERTAHRIFDSLASPFRLRLVRLAPGVFGIYRVAGRAALFDQATMERLAVSTSVQATQAVALFYDNSCATRLGVLYSAGYRDGEFGDGDAWWVPYGEDGKLVLDGPQFRITELRPEKEYECIYSAIDAGLKAIGVGPHVSQDMIKQAFCYDAAEVLAESADQV